MDIYFRLNGLDWHKPLVWSNLGSSPQRIWDVKILAQGAYNEAANLADYTVLLSNGRNADGTPLSGADGEKTYIRSVNNDGTITGGTRVAYNIFTGKEVSAEITLENPEDVKQLGEF